MTTHRWEGSVRLLSSISHGGEHAGTSQFLRREKYIQADGTVEAVPVVSGNTVRGILRDVSARLLWNDLGRPELTMAAFHFLFSGGSLVKAGAGGVLTDHQMRLLRRRVPHVSLFAGSGAGRIMEGKLMVGKLVPVCVQTADRVPAGLLDGYQPPDVWDVIQMEEFSRVDDTKRASNPAIPAGPDDVDALGVEAKTADHPVQQMRYGVETICAGTLMWWWMQLRDVTDVETAWFARTVDAWIDGGAHVGGRSATGHGRLGLNLGSWRNDPQLTTGVPLAAAGVDVADPDPGHESPSAAEVLEVLGWIT